MGETRKWMATVAICATLGGLAINLAIAGPTLLQIRAVTGSSISNIALIFPIMSVGRLLGSIPTGMCRCPRMRGPVLTLLLLIAAGMQGAVPWLDNLLLMLLSFFLLGFADGYLDAESNNIIKGMWMGEDESFLVAARTSMTVGFAIGPFLCVPFVETPHDSQPINEPCPHGVNTALSTLYEKLCKDEINPSCAVIDKLRANLTKLHEICLGLPALDQNSSMPSFITHMTKLQTLYTITACILVILGVALGWTVWLAMDDIGTGVDNETDTQPKAKFGLEWPRNLRILICVFLSVVAFCSNSINLSYIDFIATFVVIYLHKTAKYGAFVTVVCCTCAVVGSIAPIIFVRYMRATWLVGICLVISTISGILLASGAYVVAITWIGSALLGISSFAIYALLFVLADEVLGLTNKISALLVGVSAVGEIVMSFTAGRMFEPDPMNLMYILLVAFLTSDICYVSTIVIYRRQEKKKREIEYKSIHEHS